MGFHLILRATEVNYLISSGHLFTSNQHAGQKDYQFIDAHLTKG